MIHRVWYRSLQDGPRSPVISGVMGPKKWMGNWGGILPRTLVTGSYNSTYKTLRDPTLSGVINNPTFHLVARAHFCMKLFILKIAIILGVHRDSTGTWFQSCL